MPPRKASAASKKATAASKKKAVAVAEQSEEATPEQQSTKESTPAVEPEVAEAEAEAEAEPEAESSTAGGTTMEERIAKMKALRQRMVSRIPPSRWQLPSSHHLTLQSESARANRADLITSTNAARDSARNLAKLERKRKQAEAMGEKAEARETGEDLERKRAWEYTVEDNEKWDKKQARKGRRGDFSFTGE